MDRLQLEKLKGLADEKGEKLLSLYFPLVHDDPLQNRIRYKNAVARAEELLTGSGMRPADARGYLREARRLVDGLMWQLDGSAFAAFIGPGRLTYHHLPVFVAEEAEVLSSRFYLKPLIPLFSEDRFYLLALSRKEVKLFRGTRFGLEAAAISGGPYSFERETRMEEEARTVNFRTFREGRTGAHRAMFHGHGAEEEEEKEKLLNFMRHVDNSVRETLGEENSPLFLAGPDYLVALYRKANEYHNLAAEAALGAFDDADERALFAAAMPVIEPVLSRERDEAAGRLVDRIGSGLASGRPDEIIQAAHNGQVDSLFVQADVHVWGAFDPEGGTVELHAEYRQGDEELLDAAAVYTLAGGGKVYVVRPGEVPGGGAAAALYRYGFVGKAA